MVELLIRSSVEAKARDEGSVYHCDLFTQHINGASSQWDIMEHLPRKSSRGDTSAELLLSN